MDLKVQGWVLHAFNEEFRPDEMVDVSATPPAEVAGMSITVPRTIYRPSAAPDLHDDEPPELVNMHDEEMSDYDDSDDEDDEMGR